MKSTQERLAESYCRPQTEEEWVLLIGYVPESGHTLCAWSGDFGAMEHETPLYWMTTEIPVPHFINLLHDRIAPWRLEEDGFEKVDKFTYTKHPHSWQTVTVDLHLKQIRIMDSAFNNVNTYTQLLTLIEMI
jgi:hypothetical protein